MFNKKAAMFGLDARIALAIFGALSIITGAALYSAIGNAKATALLAEVQEISKAFESYYLDIGSLPPLESGTNFDRWKIENLVNNAESFSNWQGPYLSYDVDNVVSLKCSASNYVYIYRLNDAGWGGTIKPHTTATYKCSSQPCFAWILITGFDNENIFNIIDTKIDGGDGKSAGKVRMDDTPNLYVQAMPVKI